MTATIPFSFHDRKAAENGQKKYIADTVWTMTTPAFDTKAKIDFIGGPIKHVILLEGGTTKMLAIPPTEKDKYNLPSKHIEVGSNLQELLRVLGRMPMKSTGSATLPSKSIDFTAKFLSLGKQRDTTKAGKSMKAADAEFVDTTGSKIQVTIWDKAYAVWQAVPLNEGVSVINCQATREGDEIKIHVREHARILRGGPIAQSLTSFDPSQVTTQVLTAVFTPSHKPINVDGEAHPTCAAALADASASADDKIFQFNRVHIEAPTQKELLYTQKGDKLFAKCRFRDRSGVVEADVIHAAVPSLFGCHDENEVSSKLEQETLEVVSTWMNVRGVLRLENGQAKRYIAKISHSVLSARLSAAALDMALGLSQVEGDMVLSSPIDRVRVCPVSGLSV